MLIEGSVCVVTGGARGLGFAMARRLLAEGGNVVITDVSDDALAAAVESLGAGSAVLPLIARASVIEDVAMVAEATVDRFGGMDVWVNNAGFTRDATMRKMPVDDFDAVIDVHLRGAWLGTRAAADYMRDHGGGSIINVSSISGKVGNAGQTNYSAAKAGVVGLTKAAAKEVGFAGVRVNAIQPGIIRTAMTEAMPEAIKQDRLRDIPLGRFGEPDEVADVVLFLASPLSRYLTGVVIEIAGGRNI
ncbi:MAG: 3-oxoacyl-ACP reductase FabG [Microbacterium sp.]|jgi:3-oxoacyl-[acyl-carrier protein] reductase|uniref:3-oxoacyl-ACP reductase FabG n=1 Tax=Microbacterium sp. TaxID=51671 RepID=UPI001AC09530|nr:3-oxoacyl-ACP reductase FabG [Microbacterium sp.]MBN9155554.1 3-oxoacyl-ACP reductase FabG [Microbacterium sp.]